MNRMTAVLLTAFFLSAPVPAIADDGDVQHETTVLDLRDVEQYLWKASTLEEEWRELEYRHLLRARGSESRVDGGGPQRKLE
jgi:hypothetical protein